MTREEITQEIAVITGILRLITRTTKTQVTKIIPQDQKETPKTAAKVDSMDQALSTKIRIQAVAAATIKAPAITTITSVIFRGTTTIAIAIREEEINMIEEIIRVLALIITIIAAIVVTITMTMVLTRNRKIECQANQNNLELNYFIFLAYENTKYMNSPSFTYGCCVWRMLRLRTKIKTLSCCL